MTQGLKDVKIQSKVLLIYTPQWGHAICVYLYPAGNNQLWAWDETWKSIRLRAWWDNPVDIAQKWTKATGKAVTIDRAEFLE